jgi:hypothetical protein
MTFKKPAFNLVIIKDSEDWLIEYDTTTRRYRVSYFENGHFVDEVIFREYKE